MQRRTSAAYRIVVRVALFLGHRCKPDDGDDRVQHERHKEVFVECYPLTAQTPEAHTTHDLTFNSPNLVMK